MKNWKPLLGYLAAFAALVLIDRFLYAHPVIEALAMAAMVLFATRPWSCSPPGCCGLCWVL